MHGDLKPENVLLKSSGNTKTGWVAKLGDFGVARALEGGLAQQTTLTVGQQEGTFAYISPEMLERGILTAASDTIRLEYSCGKGGLG